MHAQKLATLGAMAVVAALVAAAPAEAGFNGTSPTGVSAEAGGSGFRAAAIVVRGMRLPAGRAFVVVGKSSDAAASTVAARIATSQ
jgi:hypothetical protein